MSWTGEDHVLINTTTTADSSTMSGLEPAGGLVPRIVPLVADEPAMRGWAAELVARARSEGVALTGDDGLLTALVRQVLRTGSEVEMSDHLGDERRRISVVVATACLLGA